MDFAVLLEKAVRDARVVCVGGSATNGLQQLTKPAAKTDFATERRNIAERREIGAQRLVFNGFMDVMLGLAGGDYQGQSGRGLRENGYPPLGELWLVYPAFLRRDEGKVRQLGKSIGVDLQFSL